MGDKYVITAAHCTDGLSASDIFVQIGDTSLDTEYEAPSMTVGVEEIKQHPDYNSDIISDDISVLKLAEAVSLTQYPNIKPACLPQQGRNNSRNSV